MLLLAWTAKAPTRLELAAVRANPSLHQGSGLAMSVFGCQSPVSLLGLLKILGV